MRKRTPTKSLDLATAQRIYIAAGNPEQAEAAGLVIDAVRNTVQGEWGKSFVASLENLLAKHIEPLGVDMSGLRTDVQHWASESATRLGKLETRMDASEDDRAQLRQEIEEIKRILAERPGQRAADHQALLEAIRTNGARE